MFDCGAHYDNSFEWIDTRNIWTQTPTYILKPLKCCLTKDVVRELIGKYMQESITLPQFYLQYSRWRTGTCTLPIGIAMRLSCWRSCRKKLRKKRTRSGRVGGRWPLTSSARNWLSWRNLPQEVTNSWLRICFRRFHPNTGKPMSDSVLFPTISCGQAGRQLEMSAAWRGGARGRLEENYDEAGDCLLSWQGGQGGARGEVPRILRADHHGAHKEAQYP